MIVFGAKYPSVAYTEIVDINQFGSVRNHPVNIKGGGGVGYYFFQSQNKVVATLFFPYKTSLF